MSNINNHGVDMNKIKGAADFQELTCEQAAAIQGGATIHLFEDVGFQGKNVYINYSEPTLVGTPFQDSISSVKVYSGEWI